MTNNSASGDECDLTRLEKLRAEHASKFVRHCYLLYLGREPEESGLQNWVNFLNSGSGAIQLLQIIKSSAEYISRREQASAQPQTAVATETPAAVSENLKYSRVGRLKIEIEKRVTQLISKR